MLKWELHNPSVPYCLSLFSKQRWNIFQAFQELVVLLDGSNMHNEKVMNAFHHSIHVKC